MSILLTENIEKSVWWVYHALFKFASIRFHASGNNSMGRRFRNAKENSGVEAGASI